MLRSLSVVSLGILLCNLIISGCGQDWSTHTKWPESYEFQGQRVQYHRLYRSGDFDSLDAVGGQPPARYVTYYSYSQDGEEIRHGKFTSWYEKGKPRSETVYVHGQPQDRTYWYKDGSVAQVVEKTPDGEESRFYDRSGELIGIQLWDNQTQKRTCILGDDPVSLHEFMSEINRRCYQTERITP